MISPIRFLLFAGIFVLLFQCKQGPPPKVSQESLGRVLRSYTQGIISSKSPLRYVFTQDMVEEDGVGSPLAEGIIKINPAVPGKAFWEARNVLIYKPASPFKPGTRYDVQLNLKSILPQGLQGPDELSYSLRTRENSFAVARPSLQPISEDGNLYTLTGTLNTSDFMEPSLIEKLLHASQDQQTLRASWQHDTFSNASTYVFHDIKRIKDSRIEVSWNGAPADIPKQGKYEVRVPGPGEFMILDAFFEKSPESRIVISFSDPLKANQNLTGLVYLKNQTGVLRTVTEGNKIYAYIPNELNGEQTVLLSPGILASDNKKLQESSEWDILIPVTDPAVRFTGRGTIIPQHDEIILPFEAVGLKAIDVEVFKIFDQNILQFLQVNQLEDENELYRVGKLVRQARIDLANVNPRADPETWSHYALDLQPLLEADPNAIYQIRIGFKPSYTHLNCLSAYQEESGPDPGDELISFYEDNFYGPDGYYEGYEWEDRNDPCKSAYYNNDHFISKNVLISNLGIIGKKSDKNLFVAVTDLRTAEALVGCTIEVYNFTLEKIAQWTTDQQGTVNQLLTEQPYAVVVTYQGQKGYLRMADGHNLSMSAFEVEGDEVKKGIKGFVFYERGVWRPGDSIHLSFVLNQKAHLLPEGHPVSMQVYDAQNRKVIQKISSENLSGFYSFPFKTEPDAITGNWRAVVKAGGVEFSKTLKIESIKPNRLKINWDVGEEITPTQQTAVLKAQWLTGLSASGLRALVTAQWRPSSASWPAYKEFVFQDPARVSNENPVITLFDGPLDADGSSSIPLKISKDFKPAGKMNLNFKIDVSEPGGDFSTFAHTALYHPYNQYAGIRLPMDPWGYRTLEKGKLSTIQFVSVDPAGKVQAGRKLTVGLYQMDWRWWWEEYGGSYASYNSSDHVKAMQKTTLTTNANGLAEWKVTVNQWGRYLIRVCDPVSGHCSGDFAYAGWPEDESRSFDMATLLRLQASKEKYLADEEVEINIPAPVLSRMLITIENGSQVLESHWASVDKNPYIFRFKPKPEMSPAVYVHVSLLQQHGYSGNDLPMRMYGVIPVYLDHPSTRLTPVIKAPASFRPDRNESIEVSETDGRPMAYTLDIVDEGLLDLTNYKTPDPHRHFFAKEALGVRTWDVYDQVLGAFGGRIESILSIGGDEGAAKLNDAKVVSRFKSPVIHLGPFQLKKGEKRKHNVSINNYIGSVRVMVVAAGDGAYGHAEKTMPVVSPLMILPTLPRVLSIGEQVTLPVNIFTTKNISQPVTLTVKDKNNRLKWDSSSKTLPMAGEGERLEYFTFSTGERPGETTIQLEAKSGGEMTKQEIEIEIRNPNPVISTVKNEVIEAGQSKTLTIQARDASSLQKASLEIAILQPVALGKHLDYLIRYPYGCSEQIISAAFPQLYLEQYVTLDANQSKELKNNIENAITSLSRFSLQDGSFSLWPGQANTSDNWVTSYAGHFLTEAEKKGYAVPQHLISNWKAYQKKLAGLWDPAQKALYKANHGLDQAYRLYTLALAGAPDLGAMNRLKEYGGMGNNARWRLAAAYAVAGQAEAARTLVQIPFVAEDYTESGFTYGSALRDQAMALETWLEIGDRTKAAQMALDLSKQLNQEKPWNTQALAYALQALGKFHSGAASGGNPWSFKYNYDGGAKSNINARTASILIDPVREGKIPGSVTIENTSAQPLFVQSVQMGRPIKAPEVQVSNNLVMNVQYRSTDRAPIDPGKLKKGDLVLVEVTVTHTGSRPRPYVHLAINHILPAGWEIINQRLFGSGSGVQNFDYQDIRDDRVYTFFPIEPGKSKTFTIEVRATYEGRFHLPAVVCEEMYDASIYAQVPGREVEVIP